MAFPNVPRVPGVPPLLRSPAFTQIIPQVLTGDIVGLLAGLLSPPWGIYQNGKSIIDADNTLGVEFRQDWTLANYPIEGGNLETYGKVKTPAIARVRFATGGGLQARTQFLDTVEKIAGTTELYDVVLPERTYTNCNVDHYDFMRQDGNAGFLVIDIWLKRINVKPAAQFTNTKNPTSTAKTHVGVVGTASPPAQLTLYGVQ